MHAATSGLIWPPLGKKIVSCVPVGQKKSQSGGRESFFFFPNFIFYKLECTGGKVKKKYFFDNRKKKVPVGPF